MPILIFAVANTAIFVPLLRKLDTARLGESGWQYTVKQLMYRSLQHNDAIVYRVYLRIYVHD